MKEALQRKVNLMTQNAKIVQHSSRLDFPQAATLGAMLFTAENLVASERDIRANRKLLKKKASVFSNLRSGASNVALLSRMSLKPDAEAYLNEVLTAYDAIKEYKFFRSEELVLTAMSMVEDTPAEEYASAASADWALFDQMKDIHPLLTTQADLTVIHMMNHSGMDVKAVLDEAEEIYAKLEPTGFKLKKDVLQTVSLVLALSDKPVDEKCKRFDDLRQGLKASKRRVYGQELAILAAFVDIDAPIEQIVGEIGEAESALKGTTGFRFLDLSDNNQRRMFGAVLVLQMYADEARTQGSRTNDISSVVAQNVAIEVIMTVIIAIIAADIAATTAMSAH